MSQSSSFQEPRVMTPPPPKHALGHDLMRFNESEHSRSPRSEVAEYLFTLQLKVQNENDDDDDNDSDCAVSSSPIEDASRRVSSRKRVGGNRDHAHSPPDNPAEKHDQRAGSMPAQEYEPMLVDQPLPPHQGSTANLSPSGSKRTADSDTTTPTPTQTSNQTKSSASPTSAKARRKNKSPPPSYDRLSWHESEITGHQLNSPDDDGTGINGIGFKPTPAMAYARAQKRKQQVDAWRAREAREARQGRIEKRRNSFSVSPYRQKLIGITAAGSNDEEGTMARGRKRVVRFTA